MANHIAPFLWMRGEEEGVIREEISKIDECGIKALCVEARPHPDFCGDGWWHDLGIVIDEARKRDMRIWILDDRHFPTGYANGLLERGHEDLRKTYLNFNTADIFGPSRLVTIPVERMTKPKLEFTDLGKPLDPERENNRLFAVVACRIAAGNILSEESIDLTDSVKDGYATFQLPEGAWRVYVVYVTHTDGGEPYYINVLDRRSAALQIEGVYEPHYEKFGNLFGTVIAGFFSDEPQFGNVPGFAKDAKMGTEMPLLWSEDLAKELEARHGEMLRSRLPYLWNDTDAMEQAASIRYDYMDIATRLYASCFSGALGSWCEEHGVEYIGHVVEDDGAHERCGLGAGHFFRAMSGQDHAGIDCIGGQVIYGAPDAQRRGFSRTDGEFYHYVLGKLGASSGHLDPSKKNRTLCELFGAYGWKFGVRDQKYVLEHLVSRGVNELVPHAFSMAEYPDPDCPPHYYAHGHNPEYPYFAQLMHYANALCEEMQDAEHVADVAVLYEAELEWVGSHMPMQKVARALQEHQIEFDFVSLDMLRGEFGYAPKLDSGRLEIGGVSFGALVIERSERIPDSLCSWIAAHPDFPVIFVDEVPICAAATEGRSQEEADSSWRQMLAAGNVEAVPLAELPEKLRSKGMAGVSLSVEAPFVSLYRYIKEGQLRLLALNESAFETYEGELEIPGASQYAVKDVMDGSLRKPAGSGVSGCVCSPGLVRIPLHLKPAEFKVLVPAVGDVAEDDAALTELAPAIDAEDLSCGWHVSARSATGDVEIDEGTVETLEPFSEKHPAFSGTIRYERELELSEDWKRSVLRLENVQELACIWIDGTEMGRLIQPPYELALNGVLGKGRHRIAIEVTTTADRDQLNYPHPPFDLSFDAMEATGMYGQIVLLRKE